MFLMNVLHLERFSCFFLSIFFVTCAFCKEKQWSVIKTLGRARSRRARFRASGPKTMDHRSRVRAPATTRGQPQHVICT